MSRARPIIDVTSAPVAGRHRGPAWPSWLTHSRTGAGRSSAGVIEKLRGHEMIRSEGGILALGRTVNLRLAWRLPEEHRTQAQLTLNILATTDEGMANAAIPDLRVR